MATIAASGRTFPWRRAEQSGGDVRYLVGIAGQIRCQQAALASAWGQTRLVSQPCYHSVDLNSYRCFRFQISTCLLLPRIWKVASFKTWPDRPEPNRTHGSRAARSSRHQTSRRHSAACLRGFWPFPFEFDRRRPWCVAALSSRRHRLYSRRPKCFFFLLRLVIVVLSPTTSSFFEHGARRSWSARRFHPRTLLPRASARECQARPSLNHNHSHLLLAAL